MKVLAWIINMRVPFRVSTVSFYFEPFNPYSGWDKTSSWKANEPKKKSKSSNGNRLTRHPSYYRMEVNKLMDPVSAGKLAEVE